jgi:hypothetical protein
VCCTCAQGTLNQFLELGKVVWIRVRQLLQSALRSYVPTAVGNNPHGQVTLTPLVRAQPTLALSRLCCREYLAA